MSRKCLGAFNVHSLEVAAEHESTEVGSRSGDEGAAEQGLDEAEGEQREEACSQWRREEL